MNHKLLLLSLLLLASVANAQEPTLILPTGHNRSVRALEFLPSGQFFLSGGEDGLVKLWETASGRELYTFDHHGGAYVNAIAVSADGRRMVSGGEGPGVVLSQTFSGEGLWSQNDPDLGTFAVRALAIADSSVLIARGNVLLSRQLSDGAENWRLQVSRSSLTAMAVSPEGGSVVLGDESGRCYLVDLASGEETDSWKALRNAIVWMKYAADGKTLYAASEGNRIVKMVAEGGSELQTWRVNMSEPLKGVAISADGQWLATTHLSPDLFTEIEAQLWKIKGGSLQAVRALDVGRTDYALAFTPDSQHLLTGQINTGEIAMQQVADGKMERKFTRHSETVHHLEASRYFLLTASQDLFGTARAYSLNRVGAQQFLEEDEFS
ncbi:MAG TPA: WD40 repeat domain-containing protein, partial [Phaeodactylibacter sp.]|nr:WD40 repeat domain-containing protein [Phaeodactylibacter sp.]